MVGQKKSFAVNQNKLQKSIKNLTEYSKNSKRPFLLLIEDNNGFFHVGTKKLVEKYFGTKNCETCKSEITWEDAARQDTLDLNDEDEKKSSEVAPIEAKDGNVLASVYLNNEIPKLPFPVNILSENEAATWLLPELKKDLVEQGKIPKNRMAWGNEDFHPKCWADDLVEWKYVSNISHSQKNKERFAVPLVEVLKATIKNRLELKDIDPKTYILDNSDDKKALKKKKYRGMHKPDLVEPVPTVNEIEEIDLPVVTVIEELVEDNIGDDVLNNSMNDDQNENGVQNHETDVTYGVTEELDESIERERGGHGRRVLPSRQQEPVNPVVTPEEEPEEIEEEAVDEQQVRRSKRKR